MADKKISALTASTTPLAGTEVLPIVQSGATVKVAVSDLTSGRAVSMANLFLQSATLPAAGNPSIALRSADNTVYHQSGSANTTVFLDSAQNTIAIIDKTTGVSVYGANFVVGTSGKGIDFSATPGTGTSELLADYEEGTWTPTDASGAGLSFTATSNNCFYTKIGNQVTCIFSLTYPSTASAAAATIGGLPFTSKNTSASVAGGITTFTSNGSVIVFLINSNDTIFGIRSISGISSVTNVSLSTAQVRGVLQYLV